MSVQLNLHRRCENQGFQNLFGQSAAEKLSYDELPDGMVALYLHRCVKCGSSINEPIKVKKADLDRWVAGAYVQDAFPYLSDTQRGMLMDNLCQKCEDEAFKGLK